MADKALAGTAGDQHIHAVKRVRGLMIVAMDRHRRVEIESFDFTQRRLSIGFKDEEAIGQPLSILYGPLTEKDDTKYFMFKDLKK